MRKVSYNKAERIELVRAMETVARCFNDETDLFRWTMYGVPDGEIDERTKDKDLEWLVEDVVTFADLMFQFCKCMKMSDKEAYGFLYCNGVISTEDKEEV